LWIFNVSASAEPNACAASAASGPRTAMASAKCPIRRWLSATAELVSEHHPALATFVVVTIAVLAGFLAVLRGVLVPVVFTLTSPVLAAVRAVLGRSTGDRQDSLALWQEEGVSQRLRLLRALLVTIVLAAGAAGLWLAVGDSPDVTALRQADLVDWLASRLTHFDVAWSGQLR
jgi:hypothetical protein